MSRRIHDHSAKEPRERVGPSVPTAIFFPGEVARLLGLENIEYDQLRRLFVLARTLRGEPHPGRRWSRFTLADLAAAEVLVGLGGGRDRLRSGKHLVLGEVAEACQALRGLGIENPLLEVPMARIGHRIFARVDDYIVDPATGQLALVEVAGRMSDFLEERVITDRRVRAAIAREAGELRRRRRVRVQLRSEETGVIRVLAV